MRFCRNDRPGRRGASAVLAGGALLLFAFFSAGSALAGELLLSNLVLNNYEGKIRVSFGVAATDPGQLAAALDAGEKLVLRATASLSDKRMVWDKELLRASCVSRLAKAAVVAYAVAPPDGGDPLTGRDLGELLRRAWGQIRIDLGEWRALKPGGSYVIDLEIALERGDASILDKTLSVFGSGLPAPVKYQLDFNY